MQRAPRRGMTLTELLIVVAIMVVLLGVALPLVKNGLEGRKTREAARQIHTAVQMAAGLAAQTGRAAGLILEVQHLPAAESATGFSLPYVSQIFLAETPAPYCGDSVTARATISSPANSTAGTATFDAFSGSLGLLVRSGDQIRFDYRGPLYTVTGVVGNVVTFSGWPLPPDAARLPYQVFRQLERSSSTPMELVSGAVIDLSMSGFGLLEEDTFDNGATTEVQSVAIELSPSGRMSRVLVTVADLTNPASPVISVVTIVPTETLHLLVGGIEGVQLDDITNLNTTDAIVTNMENPEAFWVSIGHQTGRPTTAENGWTIDFPTDMSLAREFAQSGRAMGGR